MRKHGQRASSFLKMKDMWECNHLNARALRCGVSFHSKDECLRTDRKAKAEKLGHGEQLRTGEGMLYDFHVQISCDLNMGSRISI